jgi:hypothetical protein
MKTPREILLARHQAAAPKLDAIRHAVLRELNSQDAKAQSWSAHFVSSCLGCLNKLWQELVLPCRRIWSGLAAAWVILLVINFAQREPALSSNAAAAPVMMSLRDQQRLLNELFADRSLPAEADRPKVSAPRPRTERVETATV